MLFREAHTPPSTWTPPKILKRKNPGTVVVRGFFLYQLFDRQLLDAQSLDEERQALTARDSPDCSSCEAMDWISSAVAESG